VIVVAGKSESFIVYLALSYIDIDISDLRVDAA
jgi:hypothetical protein